MSEGADTGVRLQLPAKVAEAAPKHAEPLVAKVTVDELKERRGMANEVLGVDGNAKPEEIRSAYFEAMKALRPDVNMDQETVELAQKINEAYAAIRDPKKLEQYNLEAAKAEAARAAAGFTASEKMNPAEVAEARKWAQGVVESLDQTQLDEMKRHSIEAAAVAHEKGMVKPEQFNYIMGHTVTTDFLQLVPNEKTQLLLQSAAEKNAGNPEALLLLLLMIMALLMEGAADLVSDDTDGFLEKVAMALAVGGMAAVYEFTERKKKEKAQARPVITVLKPEVPGLPAGETVATPTLTAGEQPAQLPAVAETHVTQETQPNIGVTFFTAAVMMNMNQNARS